MTSVMIYAHDWLRQCDKWGFLAAALLHKSFVKSSCTSGEATSKQVWGLFTPAERERERWAEGGGALLCGQRVGGLSRTSTWHCRLIESRCFVSLIVRNATCRCSTCEFNSAIGCRTTRFSSELCRLRLLISHPASNFQREHRELEGTGWS